MAQLAFTGRQALADFSQRTRPSQLQVHHGHELAPTGETARVPLGVMFLDGALELRSREQLEQLREDAAYSIHGGSLLRLKFGSAGTRISIYRNFRLPA